ARHAFHADDPQVAVLEEVVHLDDVRVVEGPDDLHLAGEAGEARFVLREEGIQHLERHLAPRPRVERAVHRRGPPVPEDGLDQEPRTDRVAVRQPAVALHATRAKSARTCRATLTSSPSVRRQASSSSASACSRGRRCAMTLPRSRLKSACSWMSLVKSAPWASWS